MEENIEEKLRLARNEGFLAGVNFAHVTLPNTPNVAGELHIRSVRLEHGEGYGSGLLIDNQYILTAKHVVMDKDGTVRSLNMVSPHRTFQWVERVTTLVAIDEIHDIALLKLEKAFPLKLISLDVSDFDILEGEIGLAEMKQFVFFQMPRPIFPVWLAGAVYSSIISKSGELVLELSDEDSQSEFLAGDSGSVGLDIFGNIFTMMVRVFIENEQSPKRGYYGVGIRPEAIRAFLKTHWPNYQG